MIQPQKFMSPVRFTITAALDYLDGYSYFDLSGKLARKIVEHSDDFVFEQGQNGSHFSNSLKNVTLIIGQARMSLSQTVNLDVLDLMPYSEFGAKADVLMNIAIDTFGLKVFTRIGYQETYLYPTTSTTEAHENLMQLPIASVPSDLEKTLGKAFDTSRTLHVVRPDFLMRLQAHAFEQSVKIPQRLVQTASQKSHEFDRNQREALMDSLKARRMINSRPQFGVQVDLDAYVLDPVSFSVANFVTLAGKDMEAVRKIVSSKEGK